MNNVRMEMNNLLIERDRIEKSILVLRSQCGHYDVKKIARSNTGNYDPSADSYWYDCTCPDCDKFWMEDQ